MTRRDELIRLTEAALRGPALARIIEPADDLKDPAAALADAALLVAETVLKWIDKHLEEPTHADPT